MQAWRGRFPRNEIISLLDVSRPFNLAESTSQDLNVGEILEIVGEEDIRALKLGYGTSVGSPALREAVAETCGVSSDHVLTTQGTALGLFLLAFEVCRRDDQALLVKPCFPPSRDVFTACGVDLLEVTLDFDSGYRLDVDRIAAALTPRTRLVSIASPQNPSGVSASHAEIHALLAFMRTATPDALLFVDETYREAVYGDAPVQESVASLDPRIVVGASISKAYGAPGLRTGWLTVADESLRERLTVAKMNIVISGSPLDEALTAGVLRNKERVLAPRRQLLAAAIDELAAWHDRERDRLDWLRPDAGALCCFRLARAVFDGAAVLRFWEALPALDLQLASGAWFGEEERIFRLGFGYLPADRLQPALRAVSLAMDRAES